MQGRSLRHSSFKVIAASALFAVSGILGSIAQSATPPKIDGHFNATYGYDLIRPLSRTSALRSFDRKTDAFLLNAGQINLEGDLEKNRSSYRVEFDYGTDAAVFKSAGTGADAGLPAAPANVAVNFEVQEAFVTYKSKWTSIMTKFGKFATFEGIEVIESKDNFTISRGLLFGLAEPYTHTGVVFGYNFPKYVDVWLGVVNGWDLYTDNNSGKTMIAKIGLNFGERLFGSFSMSRGAEKLANTNDALTSFDTTWFVKPIKPVTVALQFNVGENEKSSIHPNRATGASHWYGFGLQPKWDITKMFFVGSRYEWFSDLDGNRTATTQIVQNITLSPGVNLTEDLMFRTEFRYDWSSRLVFETSDGVFSKGEHATLGAEFVYKFN